MRYFTGLDISMKTTSVCVVDHLGKLIYQTTVSTEPQCILDALKPYIEKIEKIGLESGSISFWLVKELRNLGLPAICIDAHKMSKVLTINVNKTDKNDARMIAEVIRCGFYSEVIIKSDELIEIGMCLSSRRTLINTGVKLKNTIRGHLKSFGIRLGSSKPTQFCMQVREAISSKSDLVKLVLASLLDAYEQLLHSLKALDSKIIELAKDDEDVKLLQTIPGVGLITAFTFKVQLGDPRRFKKSRSVGAYFGLTPNQYSSGETVRQGRISKRGEKEMRALLNEAAMTMLYRTKTWSHIKVWGLKIKKKKGHKKATMALGRKLSTIMHRMLVSRKPFEYNVSNKTMEEIKRLEKAVLKSA